MKNVLLIKMYFYLIFSDDLLNILEEQNEKDIFEKYKIKINSEIKLSGIFEIQEEVKRKDNRYNEMINSILYIYLHYRNELKYVTRFSKSSDNIKDISNFISKYNYKDDDVNIKEKYDVYIFNIRK